jgi:hypothetical protein
MALFAGQHYGGLLQIFVELDRLLYPRMYFCALWLWDVLKIWFNTEAGTW